VEGLPAGWHSRHQAAARNVQAERGRIRRRRLAGRLSSAVVIITALGLALPAAAADADPASPNPTLKQLLAAAAKLSQQIDALSQQYDALRIQYNEAKAQIKVAHLTLARDQGLLASSQAAIAQIAAAGYMTGGVNPAVSLLESKNPQSMLDRASILGQLQKEDGAKLQLVTSARQAAQRARLMAVQQERQAAKLSAAMRGKVAKIQANQNKLNSAAFAKALQIYRQTGKYPPIQVNGSSLEIHALRIAMTAIGDAYSWGAAGPNTFDCSGLVVWAYAQLGVSLPHFTGWLWNSGVHVSRSQLRPGDLVFFFAGISHVGIYVGHGFMLDAPTFGIPVGIHKMLWGAYDGAVRIA
jgi:peptidoglycan DL-endopeptidase CwlO